MKVKNITVIISLDEIHWHSMCEGISAHLTGLKRWMASYSLIIGIHRINKSTDEHRWDFVTLCVEAIFLTSLLFFLLDSLSHRKKLLPSSCGVFMCSRSAGGKGLRPRNQNFLLLHGRCQKIWLASVFCNLQIYIFFFSSSLARWRSEPAVRKNVKNEGTVSLFSLTDELDSIISSKQRRKHVHHGVRWWWTCLLWCFFPSRKQRTGRSDSHRISMMDVSSAGAGAFKSAPPQLSPIRTDTMDPHTLTLLVAAVLGLLPHGGFILAGFHRLTPAHFTSSICFSSPLRYCHCCIVVFCSANHELCYLFAEGQLCWHVWKCKTPR